MRAALAAWLPKGKNNLPLRRMEDGGRRQQRQHHRVQRKQGGIAQGKFAFVDVFQVFPKQQQRKGDAHGRCVEEPQQRLHNGPHPFCVSKFLRMIK